MRPERIGITTTVPAEFIFAAGAVPVDLNNIFITDISPSSFIEEAQVAGFPRATCGWIKGMYGAAKAGGIDAIVAVSDGDCSHTRSLLEILHSEGMPVIPFAYPYDRDPETMKRQMEKLGASLGVTIRDATEWMHRLDTVRRKLWEIDLATWKDDKVSGFENHLMLVSASDFDGDPEKFGKKADMLLEEASRRTEFPQRMRLAFIGVPPITEGLYQFLETRDARVVFNEVQRQFTFPAESGGLVERYLRYTYPYDVFARIEDIKRELERRNVHGVIHYVQSFCHRQMEDVLFRKSLGLPILTIEGDSPQPLDARTRLRIESFLEMLSSRAREKEYIR